MNWYSFWGQGYSFFLSHCKLFSYLEGIKKPTTLTPWNPPPPEDSTLDPKLQLRLLCNRFFPFKTRPSSTKRSLFKVLRYIPVVPYYFYLVHAIYHFYLIKINLFLSIPYPNQVYDKEKKNFLAVICKTSCSEIFISQDGVLQRSVGCTKSFFLVANHGDDLW